MEIPGFYYDSSCDRYFKVNGSSSLPKRSSSIQNDLKCVSNERINVIIQKIKRSHMVANFPSFLESREHSRLYTMASFKGYLPYCFAHLQLNQTVSMDNAIGRPTILDSRGGTRIHVIDSLFPLTALRQYRINWSRKDPEKNNKKSGRIQFRMTSCPRSYEGPNCYGSNDATWLVEGRKLACISSDSLSFLKSSGTGYELLESVHLRRLADPRFAQPAIVQGEHVTSFPEDFLMDPPIFFTGQKVITYDGLVRLLMASDLPSRRDTQRCRVWPLLTGGGGRFTAVAKAADRSVSTVYIAAKSQMGDVGFSLFTLHQTPWLEELIRFRDSSPRSMDANNDVTSLQCLLSPSGDRTGIVVGRRSGLVQFWEDRWPSRPAINFEGSNCGFLGPLSSPCPPRPVVEMPWQTTIASPILGQFSIGLWDLKSGRLINAIDYSSTMTTMVDPNVCLPPPLLLLRSQWGCDASKCPKRGPGLLVVDSSVGSFFCL